MKLLALLAASTIIYGCAAAIPAAEAAIEGAIEGEMHYLEGDAPDCSKPGINGPHK